MVIWWTILQYECRMLKTFISKRPASSSCCWRGIQNHAAKPENSTKQSVTSLIDGVFRMTHILVSIWRTYKRRDYSRAWNPRPQQYQTTTKFDTSTSSLPTGANNSKLKPQKQRLILQRSAMDPESGNPPGFGGAVGTSASYPGKEPRFHFR